ncbi:hypothetical protein FJ527_26390 [Mesorhizobium sp. B2-4-18]|uniref:hypothetical protein n=1 Tax=Mesorhizobium sp. B2-4-18 TaxID=2589931 RepID=UPI00112E0C92|nr:hypothetical protein [Mesorhizobium sp. B2-4-18]TPK71574.1 hypothetical protein FJ527_26390 [Mesorhizobium sp. B2-4-18]
MTSHATLTRRAIFGVIASLPAIAGAAALPAPLALLITPPTPPTRESAKAKLRSIEDMLDTLPPEVAARVRSQFYDRIEHVWSMKQSGASLDEVKAWLTTTPWEQVVI